MYEKIWLNDFEDQIEIRYRYETREKIKIIVINFK